MRPILLLESMRAVLMKQMTHLDDEKVNLFLVQTKILRIKRGFGSGASSVDAVDFLRMPFDQFLEVIIFEFHTNEMGAEEFIVL